MSLPLKAIDVIDSVTSSYQFRIYLIFVRGNQRNFQYFFVISKKNKDVNNSERPVSYQTGSSPFALLFVTIMQMRIM